VLVDIPELSFLMVDGQGDPNVSHDDRVAVQALFAASYVGKFAITLASGGIDYRVMPLEGLWWVDDLSRFTIDDKAGWKWTVLIAQPELVTDELVQRAVTTAAAKRPLPAGGGGCAWNASGRARRPAAAPSPLERRGADHRAAAQVHRPAEACPARQAPRDLPDRPLADHARAVKTVIRQPVADEGPTGPMNLGPTAHDRGRRGVGGSLRRTAGTRQARPTGNGERMSWLHPTAMGTRRTEATRSTCHPSYLVGSPDLGAPAPPRSVG
jgi:hypothetical protein